MSNLTTLSFVVEACCFDPERSALIGGFKIDVCHSDLVVVLTRTVRSASLLLLGSRSLINLV